MAPMDRHGWDERYAAREQTFVREPNRLIAEEVAGLTPGGGTALDLATGEGRHAVWLAALGWRVVAVDFSAVGLARAAQRAADEGVDVAYAVADVHRLRFPPERFDLVLLSFFHPRLPERAALYEGIARTLRPGGSLLQVSYALANLTEGAGGPQDPEILVDPPVVASRLEELGLDVLRADTARITALNADGQEVEVIDAVIHARTRNGRAAPQSRPAGFED